MVFGTGKEKMGQEMFVSHLPANFVSVIIYRYMLFLGKEIACASKHAALFVVFDFQQGLQTYPQF